MGRFAAELRWHVRRADASDVEPRGGWPSRRPSSVEPAFSRRPQIAALVFVLAAAACARGDRAADEVPAQYADDFGDWRAYPILNLTFDQIGGGS